MLKFGFGPDDVTDPPEVRYLIEADGNTAIDGDLLRRIAEAVNQSRVRYRSGRLVGLLRGNWSMAVLGGTLFAIDNTSLASRSVHVCDIGMPVQDAFDRVDRELHQSGALHANVRFYTRQKH